MERPRITVIGSANMDLITYVNRMPRRGETIEAPRFEMGFGGKGANQAVAAALLGADVAMIAKVGDDIFGSSTIDNFRKFGIDVRHVGVERGVSSGVAPIFVEPDSSNSILIIKGANDLLEARDLEAARDRIASSDMVILQLEIKLETVYRAIELCEELGVPAILNPAPANANLDKKRLRSLFLFAPNETELHTLTGMRVDGLDDARAAARTLLAEGIPRVLVTLGDKGSLLVAKDGEHFAKAVKVDSLDTTGAGDAFIGCFAVRHCETGDDEKAMEDANRYAALSTMKRGTQKSFPSREAFRNAQTGDAGL